MGNTVRGARQTRGARPDPALQQRDATRAVADAAAGLLLALALTLLVGHAVVRLPIVDQNVATLLRYLAVWVPLSAAMVAATRWHGGGSFARDLGLRFTPLDLLWGLSIGLLARVAATVIELSVYGAAAQPAASFGPPARDLWWLFGAMIAPAIIAPVLEELFFRGLVLRSLLARFGSPAFAVAVSALVFSAVHLLQIPLGPSTAVVGASLLLFGGAVGTLAVLTGRTGGPIIAHVTFNALVLVPALL